jgi:hypothetical protein
VISQVLGGAGLGFSLLGGIGYIHRYAPAHHRGQLISAFYLACYIAQGVISTFAGLAATAWGLQDAINVFAPIIAVLGVMATLVAVTTRTPSVVRPAGSGPSGSGPAGSPVARPGGTAVRDRVEPVTGS